MSLKYTNLSSGLENLFVKACIRDADVTLYTSRFPRKWGTKMSYELQTKRSAAYVSYNIYTCVKCE